MSAVCMCMHMYKRKRKIAESVNAADQSIVTKH